MEITTVIKTGVFPRHLLEMRVEAYRYMFSIGVLHAVTGSLVWVLYRLGWMQFYPSDIHPLLMSGGFLLSFAFGFLWTAVPRFTQTQLPTFSELLPLMTTTFASLITSLLHAESMTLFFMLCSCVLTIVFAMKRFSKRLQNPPDSFIFVGIALVLGTVCVAVLFTSHFVTLPSPMYNFARSFFLKGVMLFLTMGVGFRLIPAILGVSAPLTIETVNAAASQRAGTAHIISTHVENTALLILLLTAFALESTGYIVQSSMTFATALLWSGLRGFHVHRIPKLRNRFAFFVWMSVVMMVATPLIIIFIPEQAVHVWHLFFIGGLGLITVMVSTRVTLSHSGAVVHNEERRAFVAWMGWLIIIAALTRASVAWLPSLALNHYLYAALLFIAAMSTWFTVFLHHTIQAERIKFIAHSRTETLSH